MSELADRGDLVGYGERLLSGERGLFFFPIRHHSPACALHLSRAIADIAPRALVIEMPADFAPLLPLLAHPETRTPVAIVSVAARGAEERVPIGHWPLSATAPEWAALRAAWARALPVFLADSPSGVRLMEARSEDASPNGSDLTPTLLTDEGHLAFGRYARNLVDRLGARDFNEAWDRLFESRAAESDWRGFFRDVGVHCALTRMATPKAAIGADDTLPRESFMRRTIVQALATSGEGPIAVVTGGFHTPALLDPPAEPDPVPPVAQDLGATPYLVRFTHEHLDRINGYGAGMPSPRWYERVHSQIASGSDEPFLAAASDMVLDLSARLRRDQPGFAPPLPAMVETLRQARGLADLRGLPGPGRCEVLDAARSCLVKDEDPRTGSPLMDALLIELAGEGIGEVPRAAGSPPLVEAVRSRARALSFRIEDGAERARTLDLHRRRRHRAASRFLHATALLGTGFAQCRQGPDWAGGVSTDILNEQWTYRWSTAVETRLVALAAEAATIERAAAAVLDRRVRALGEEGRDRNASSAVRLLVVAAQAGLAGACGPLVAAIGDAVAADPDFGRVVAALAALDNLCRGRAVLGLAETPDPGRLRAAAFRRSIDLLPTLRNAREEDVPRLVEALAGLNELAEADAAGSPSEDVPALDLDLLDEVVAALLRSDLAPRVAGAVAALAHVAGRLDADALATLLGGALEYGGELKNRVEPLAGLLAVQPALLKRAPAVLKRVDHVLARMTEDDFLNVLPALRLAFTALAPGMTDTLAAGIADLKGSDLELAPRFASGLGERELIGNVRADAALVELLRADGLGDWLTETSRDEAA